MKNYSHTISCFCGNKHERYCDFDNVYLCIDDQWW